MTASSATPVPPRNSSASLRRALSILLCFGDDTSGRGLTVSEVGEALGLNKSTVSRLIQPLLSYNFIEAGERPGSYKLSWQNASLGQAYLSSVRADRDMHPVLLSLSSRTRETVHLVRANPPRVVYIDKIDSPHAVRMVSRVGNTQPMHCTSVGKSILAFADESTLDLVIQAGLPRHTAATITNPAELRAELGTIRERGWAMDNVENEEGIRCVAAPIFDADGECSFAISISAPANRITYEKAFQLAPLVTEAAAEVSRRLGGACIRSTATGADLPSDTLTRSKRADIDR